MISYLAMAVALQAAPAITPAKRRRPLGEYFATADYPASALRAREDGRVDAALTVGADGRVIGCTVMRSSGSAALDAATCRVLRLRARYAPARDARGAAVVGNDVARLIWFLPGPGSPRAAVIDAEFVVAPPPIMMVPPPPPGLRSSGWVPPGRARANLGSYFSTDDYPAAALRAEAQGDVRFELAIGPDGRVANCTVTSSSGSPDLDNATCRILRSRARYTPARDQYGNPTTGLDRGVVRWRLPVEPEPEAAGELSPPPLYPTPPPPVPAPPPPRTMPPQRARANLGSYFSADDYPAAALRARAEGTTRVMLRVGVDGRVEDCVVTGSSGSPQLDLATCRILRSRARYTPARDAQGAPMAGVDWGAIPWRLPASPPAAPKPD